MLRFIVDSIEWKAAFIMPKDYNLTPKPGKKIDLAAFDPGYHATYDEDTADAEVASLRQQLDEWQEKLFAEGKQSLLCIFQAMDTGGKDGVIKKVFETCNPQGMRVASFKAPTPDELARNFLWRIQNQVPPKGHIGIFNRSHYEDVLVVRVNQLVPKKVWKSRFEQINEFEQLLTESGTTILKFYLHISKDEQKQRLEARLADPKKQWKFSTGDLPVRERWDDYMAAYADAIGKCNTEAARWHIVPANHKWYRDLVVMRAVVGALEQMNPQYPPPEPGLDQVVIPD
jgi:PPK2 family polyphosphate:nucleotide phosphotransferase